MAPYSGRHDKDWKTQITGIFGPAIEFTMYKGAETTLSKLLRVPAACRAAGLPTALRPSQAAARRIAEAPGSCLCLDATKRKVQAQTLPAKGQLKALKASIHTDARKEALPAEDDVSTAIRCPQQIAEFIVHPCSPSPRRLWPRAANPKLLCLSWKSSLSMPH